MRRIFWFFTAVVAAFMITSSVRNVIAAPMGRSGIDGYVVYRQNFSDVSTPEAAGIRKGRSGADGFGLSVADGALRIENYDDLRAYVLFPEVEVMDTYTIEFSFRFTDIASSNGYIAFMLTCTGEEPDNITAATVRVDGKCGNFGNLTDRMKRSLENGELVTVTIPIENRTLHQMTVKAGDVEKTLILENVTDIVKGGFGFVARNASVEIIDVELIRGVDFVQKCGPYSKVSTWSDARPYGSADENGPEADSQENSPSASEPDYPKDSMPDSSQVNAPQTGDSVGVLASAVAVSALIAIFTAAADALIARCKIKGIE